VIKTRFAAIFLAMTLGICSMPQASDAQQPRKISRVAIFALDCTDKKATVRQAFENGLREAGYNIGQNIAVDCRSSSPERDDLVREIARNLVRENVDVILTPGTQVTRVRSTCPAILFTATGTTPSRQQRKILAKRQIDLVIYGQALSDNQQRFRVPRTSAMPWLR
jgi:ABC-type uncharacterized transport system substrate-binding protein